jgi:hypothetical protein
VAEDVNSALRDVKEEVSFGREGEIFEEAYGGHLRGEHEDEVESCLGRWSAVCRR